MIRVVNSGAGARTGGEGFSLWMERMQREDAARYNLGMKDLRADYTKVLPPNPIETPTEYYNRAMVFQEKVLPQLKTALRAETQTVIDTMTQYANAGCHVEAVAGPDSVTYRVTMGPKQNVQMPLVPEPTA